MERLNFLSQGKHKYINVYVMVFCGRGILSHTQFWITSMIFSSTQQILLFALDTGDYDE